MVALDITWIVGTKSDLSLWNDAWIDGRCLADILPMTDELQFSKCYRVCDIIRGGEWALPTMFREAHHDVAAAIEAVEIVQQEEDEII